MAKQVDFIEDRLVADREARLASARRAILQAFAVCITQTGYSQTSVTDIVRKARVSKTTFYAVFSDKEDAFTALYRSLVGAQLQLVRDVDAAAHLAGADWRGRLDAVMKAYVEAVVGGGRLARCMLVEVHGISDVALRERRAAIEGHIELLVQLNERVNVDEGLNSRPSRGAFVGAVGGVYELLLQAIESETPDLDVVAADAVDLVGLIYVASEVRPST